MNRYNFAQEPFFVNTSVLTRFRGLKLLPSDAQAVFLMAEALTGLEDRSGVLNRARVKLDAILGWSKEDALNALIALHDASWGFYCQDCDILWSPRIIRAEIASFESVNLSVAAASTLGCGINSLIGKLVGSEPQEIATVCKFLSKFKTRGVWGACPPSSVRPSLRTVLPKLTHDIWDSPKSHVVKLHDHASEQGNENAEGMKKSQIECSRTKQCVSPHDLAPVGVPSDNEREKCTKFRKKNLEPLVNTTNCYLAPVGVPSDIDLQITVLDALKLAKHMSLSSACDEIGEFWYAKSRVPTARGNLDFRVIRRGNNEPLTESEVRACARILNRYTLDELLLAIRRRGEDSFRRPTFRSSNGKVKMAHQLVSLRHICSKSNFDRLISMPELDTHFDWGGVESMDGIPSRSLVETLVNKPTIVDWRSNDDNGTKDS